MTVTISTHAKSACSFVVSLALLFSLGGCTHTEDENETSLHATLGVENVFTTGTTVTATTRAESIKVTSGKLRVGVRNEDGHAAVNGEAGPTFQCTDGIWTISDPAKSIGLNSLPVSLYAYYPQDKFTISGDEVSFTTQVYSDDNDLYYAPSSKKPVTAVSPGAIFELQHVYVRIRLSLTRAATFTGTGNISLFRLKAVNGTIDLDGTLNINTGVSSSSNPSNEGFMYSLNTTIVADTPNTDCDILIPPQATPADGMTFTLVVDGNARSSTVPRSKLGNTLNANSLYTIHSQIEADGIVTVNNAIMEGAWGEPTGGDFGELVEGLPVF